MTLRELFYKVKNSVSKVADWSVLKTIIIATLIATLGGGSYWLYSEKKQHEYWVNFYYERYSSIAEKAYFRACLENAALYSELALKKGYPSNASETCSFDATQNAMFFAMQNAEKISFKEYLIKGLPGIRYPEEIELLAKNAAAEMEIKRVEEVKTQLEKLSK